MYEYIRRTHMHQTRRTALVVVVVAVAVSVGDEIFRAHYFGVQKGDEFPPKRQSHSYEYGVS